MTEPDEAFENHTLVVRDGRILDLLPQAAAAARYRATVTVDRPDHLLLPGFVDAHAGAGPGGGSAARPERRQDSALLDLAVMLRGGTSCFCSTPQFPVEAARLAAEQGLRAVIGVPIDAAAGAGSTIDDPITRALELRDEYRGHPHVSTAFAPLSPALSETTLRRVATLADELDAAIVMRLHESVAAVELCTTRHGLRPLDRLQGLGLLTPALVAVDMLAVNAADLELARRSGLAVVVCPEVALASGGMRAAVAAWAASGLRMGIGSGGAAAADLWGAMHLVALLGNAGVMAAGARPPAWAVLAAATRGGAAALGLDAEIGTLQSGKWADLCCVALNAPAMLAAGLDSRRDPGGTPAAAVVHGGGRDVVSDVWVSGRHLLNDGAFTRLDWPALAARVSGWREHPTSGRHS